MYVLKIKQVQRLKMTFEPKFTTSVAETNFFFGEQFGNITQHIIGVYIRGIMGERN